MSLRGLPLLLALASCVLSSTVQAEPAFAVRTGYRCSQCHMNRTGGGIRSSFGSLYAQTALPTNLLRLGEESPLLPADPDARFALGADVRLQYAHVATREGSDVSSFQVGEANVYGEVRLIPQRLSLYVDEKVGPGGASARETFGIVSMYKERLYVKAGKFLPAYGWRLPDDASYIRQFTGFAYSSPDTGVEIGAEPGRWSVHFAVLNGAGGDADTDESKRLVLQTVRRFEKVRVGIQGANNVSGGTRTTHAGVHGGANFGRLALLGEADWVRSRDGTDELERLIAYLEGDLLVSRGLNVKLIHDYIDPDLDIETDARTRDSLGVETIPWPFVQLRAFVRVSDGPPQVPGSRDVQLDLEAHLFF